MRPGEVQASQCAGYCIIPGQPVEHLKTYHSGVILKACTLAGPECRVRAA